MDQAGNNTDQRCFSGAILAYKAVDVTFLYAHIYMIQYPMMFVAFAKSIYLQNRFIHSHTSDH